MLTATNVKLTKQLEETQSYINKLKQDIVDINANIKPPRKGQQPDQLMNNDK
jgi:septal ring factor EnvC (AmiA/AmiB activator)